MSTTTDNNEMAYRMLGNTGLQVSVFSFGFWASYGKKDDLKDDAGLAIAKDVLRVARKGGINFFDNAEMYGNYGAAEVIMGQAIVDLRKEEPELWRRSDILVSTKIFWGGPGVNENGLSRKHVNEGTDAALKRLQVDYVDMIYCHRPDPLTPTETIVRVMSDIVRSGKATAWGTSEWSAQQITEAVWFANSIGAEPPMFEQPQYNLYHRERVEQEYSPLYKAPYNMGTTIWSPLASGLLTGKYNDSIPEDSRIASGVYGFIGEKLKTWQEDGTIDTVRKLTAYAKKELDCSMALLALAWCVKNENVTTVLLGASKPSQITENLGALAVARKMTPEHMKAIDEMLGNKPDAYQGYGGAGTRAIKNTL